MRVLIAGMGNQGAGWYAHLRDRFGAENVTVVEPSDEAAARLDPKSPRFPAMPDALAAAASPPDFFVNVTPPAVHTRLNLLAFDAGIPVLCEKPIAPTYDESRRAVEAATAAGVPFVIAENYRREAAFRRARTLIRDGAIGRPGSLHVALFQNFRTEKPYWGRMGHPFLEDCAIHLLDGMRDFLGSEPVRVAARSRNPPGSWHPRPAAASVLVEFEGGVSATMIGNLASRGALTSWRGHWRIGGEEGTLDFDETHLHLHRDDGVEDHTPTQAEMDANPGCLDDFLSLLEGADIPDSTGADYLQTQLLLHATLVAADRGGFVDVATAADIPWSAPE